MRVTWHLAAYRCCPGLLRATEGSPEDSRSDQPTAYSRVSAREESTAGGGSGGGFGEGSGGGNNRMALRGGYGEVATKDVAEEHSSAL